jgi:hypothetical protein
VRSSIYLAMAATAALLAAPALGLQRRGAPDLSRYAGRYPFDRVGGVRFLNHPLVRQAVANAAPSVRIRARILREGTSGLVVVTRAMVLAWACEPHNCGSHNWSIVIGRRNQAQFVCYKPDGGTARWYRRQREVAGGDSCPFEAAEVPAAVLDAA